ncbi:CBS domain-containing protein [Shewanella amazonensis]|uniref:Acetoin utilization protein AcuB, putative n=1 Tax=Shewanella amazonensis (strain ATCC BAA-1098 / SB2B) TaxID=326297 RepID=A1S491_SHEAM|nr:CBS domain-containing protein [Shewanella amazonensis]ABL99197.1 acetoin utilization protein AcuB, putative [Shewanella amazonensis SB2B]
MELSIADIMVTRVVTVEMDDRLQLVKEIFDQASFHHLPVVDEDGTLSGMLSERDLLRAISPHIGAIGETNRDQETLLKRVHQVMTREPVTIAPHKSLDDASLLMLEYSIGSLPVLEDGKLVGIITWKDLLRAYSHLGRRP